MFRASTERIDQELDTIKDIITTLRFRLHYSDEQMQHIGPALEQKNCGVKHCVYMCPPVSLSCGIKIRSYEI